MSTSIESTYFMFNYFISWHISQYWPAYHRMWLILMGKRYKWNDSSLISILILWSKTWMFEWYVWVQNETPQFAKFIYYEKLTNFMRDLLNYTFMQLSLVSLASWVTWLCSSGMVFALTPQYKAILVGYISAGL